VRAGLARGREQLVGVGQPLVQRHHEHTEPERLLAAAGQLAEQVGRLVGGQAVQVDGQVGAEPPLTAELVRVDGVIGHR
jgi:hypothetical protein